MSGSDYDAFAKPGKKRIGNIHAHCTPARHKGSLLSCKRGKRGIYADVPKDQQKKITRDKK